MYIPPVSTACVSLIVDTEAGSIFGKEYSYIYMLFFRETAAGSSNFRGVSEKKEVTGESDSG